MPRKAGFVVLGIGEEVFGAHWAKHDKKIVFTLDEPLPYGPYKGQKRIYKTYSGWWDDFFPYQFGGEIVDETIAAIARPGEIWGTLPRPRRSKGA